MINGLKDVAKYAMETIHDFATLGEMLTFIYAEETWRPEAEQGEHDDLVMSLAIAHQIRGQQSTRIRVKDTGRRTRWTEDMMEDFNNASEAERKLLLQMWGEPE